MALQANSLEKHGVGPNKRNETQNHIQGTLVEPCRVLFRVALRSGSATGARPELSQNISEPPAPRKHMQTNGFAYTHAHAFIQPGPPPPGEGGGVLVL